MEERFFKCTFIHTNPEGVEQVVQVRFLSPVDKAFDTAVSKALEKAGEGSLTGFDWMMA